MILVASDEQAKLEVEKLLNAKRNAAKASEKTAQKAAQASQLIDEIGKIHSSAQLHSPPPSATEHADSDKISIDLADRIGRLEAEQSAAREQIQRLLEAKKKLEIASRKAREQADKQQEETNAKLQQQLNTLIKNKEAEYQRIREQIAAIKNEAEQKSMLLKAQRDAARIMAQEHQEATESHLDRTPGSGHNWLLITGSVFGIFLVLAVLFLLFGDKIVPVVRNFIDPPAATVNATAPATDTDTSAATETEDSATTTEAVPQQPIQPVRAYRDRLKSGGLGPVMIEVPGGTYLLGAMPQQPYPDELPQTRIELNNFSISKHEITVEEYSVFAKATNRAIPTSRQWTLENNMPIINVSWEDATEYTTWLSAQTGRQYRLPSEREWEYAASAGMKNTYPWGNHLGENNANCASCGSRWDARQPAPVGSFAPNPLGLHDIIGNVDEWVLDCRRNNYVDTPTSGQTWEGGDCSRRMVRGGSFRTYESALRLTKRKSMNPKARSDDLGFRIVRVG
jgi:formylglycine-generating enzyme required for sulfatase activity